MPKQLTKMLSDTSRSRLLQLSLISRLLQFFKSAKIASPHIPSTAMDWPAVLAHRGAPQYAPENTLVSLKKAGALGAQWVEFDVMLTRDGIPIIMHDWCLNRTTNGCGYVSRQTWEEVQTLDAGSHFSAAYQDEKVPTLKAWLTVCLELGMSVNIEIKEKRCRATKVATAIHAVLQEFQALPNILISSATPACLKAYRQLDKTISLGLIRDYWDCFTMRRLSQYHCDFLVLNAKWVTEKRVRLLHQKHYGLLAYTVNCKQQYDALKRLGVDGVFTDNLKTVVPPGVH